MVRKGSWRRTLPMPGDVPPHSMWGRLFQYLEWLEINNYSRDTVQTHKFNVGRFIRWCEERAILSPVDVNLAMVERYQRHLFYYRKTNGKPLSFQVQAALLSSLRTYFRWLTRQHLVLYNPTSELELPRNEHRLPRDIMSAAEVEKVLAQPDISTPLGLRDRAILELMYSTGVRRQEVVGLRLYDLDMERRHLMVRLGKGKKDRLLPVGERAMAWIEKYLAEARPKLVLAHDDGELFLGRCGTGMTKEWLSVAVHRYVMASGINKHGSCHMFRHTLATLMLENGADIRYVQIMLGHTSLSTTEIYTQVSIKVLQEVHDRTHPASRLRVDRPSDDGHSTSGLELLEQALELEAMEEQAEDS